MNQIKKLALALLLALPGLASAEIQFAQATGTINAVSGTVKMFADSLEVTAVDVAGSITATTLVAEGAVTGTAVSTEASLVWRTLPVYPIGFSVSQTTMTDAGLYKVDTAGLKWFRVRASIHASGNATVIIGAHSSPGGSPGQQSGVLPSGGATAAKQNYANAALTGGAGTVDGMAVNVSRWAGVAVGPPRGLGSSAVANTDIVTGGNVVIYGTDTAGAPARINRVAALTDITASNAGLVTKAILHGAIGSTSGVIDAVSGPGGLTATASYGMYETGIGADGIRMPNGNNTGLRPQIAVTTAAASTLWTPTSGKKFRLMQLELTFPYSFASATAAQKLTLFDGATTITPHVFNAPVAALATHPGAVVYTLDFGQGWLSGEANTPLTVTLGANATAASVGMRPIGTEE